VYKYFVFYHFQHKFYPSINGISNAVVSLNEPIVDIEQINNMQKEIERIKEDHRNIVIANIVRLED
jgi:hypothetical protein